MKTIATLILTAFAATAFAQGAKQPEGITKTAPQAAVAPAATPAKAEVKKEDKKPAKSEPAKKEPAKAAVATQPAAPATK